MAKGIGGQVPITGFTFFDLPLAERDTAKSEAVRLARACGQDVTYFEELDPQVRREVYERALSDHHWRQA